MSAVGDTPCDTPPGRGLQGCLAALASLDAMGPGRLRALLGAMCPDRAWHELSTGTALRHGSWPVSGEGRTLFPAAVLRSWCESAASVPELPALMSERLSRCGVDALAAPHLPRRLSEDMDPPGVLFVSGSARGCLGGTEGGDGRSGGPAIGGPAVAIVGTRRASEYGLGVARRLGRELAAAGVGIVSGLALGIDAAAHAGALGAGPSAAPGVVHLGVLGAGHDRPCPSRNRALARSVAGCGALLSEVPPGVASAPWRYPVRNRLIAALADVVVVVESASRGGSMSTVEEALVRDRVVMAVPGAVGRRGATGCHDLIRDGAGICTGAHDVIEALELLGFPTGAGPAHQSGVVAHDPLQAAVLDALCDGPLCLDAVARKCSLEVSRLSALLVEMQAAGLLACESGWVRLR